MPAPAEPAPAQAGERGPLTRLILDQAPRARDSKIIAVTDQDVEPILEHAKALADEPQRGDFCRHVASVPNVLLVGLLNDEHARGNTGLRMFSPEFNALVECKLASDWKHFRVG
jgi:hypothetical protein